MFESCHEYQNSQNPLLSGIYGPPIPMTNIEAIINLTKEIERLENNVDVLYEERSNLVDQICQWMARTHKQHVILGNVVCSLEVYSDGTFNWYGIVSRATLDIIEQKFLNYLLEERAALKERLL